MESQEHEGSDMSMIANNAKAIFLEAIEKHSPDDWSKFLDEACGQDDRLRQRVEGLLQAHKERDSLFDRAPATVRHETPEYPSFIESE